MHAWYLLGPEECQVSLELKLQMVMSCCMGTGMQTWIFRRVANASNHLAIFPVFGVLACWGCVFLLLLFVSLFVETRFHYVVLASLERSVLFLCIQH